MKVLAIIPARKGSKGIIGKNLINFSGKPLIQWSIEAALKSKVITDVVVSSDGDEILEYAEKNRDILTIKRPKELAEDTSETAPVLLHALEELKHKNYDYLILLQPTSPLRTSDDIDTAFHKLIELKANSLISVCTMDYHPYKAFKINENGFLQGIINNDFPFSPRQELPQTVKANGAIYIISVQEFLLEKTLLTSSTAYFEMSKEKSLDIDTLDDTLGYNK